MRIGEILFTQENLEILRELRGSTPRRIVSDEVTTFWFDYGERHLAASFHEFTPLSQNERDDALGVRPYWREGPYRGNGKVLFENQRVDDVLVVQTLLWFSDHVEFASREEALEGFGPPRNETDRSIQEILAKSTGGHEAYVTSPLSVEEVAAPVANLVEVGFLAVVGGRRLACFCQQNSTIRDADFVEDFGPEFHNWYSLQSLDAVFGSG